MDPRLEIQLLERLIAAVKNRSLTPSHFLVARHMLKKTGFVSNLLRVLGAWNVEKFPDLDDGDYEMLDATISDEEA